MKADLSKLCCLSCDKPMRFARSTYRPIGLPKVQTFECRDCGLAVTAEAAAEVGGTQFAGRRLATSSGLVAHGR
jgi:hypothetical protein